MYRALVLLLGFSFILGQSQSRSIHQIELEKNKKNYLEPFYKYYSGPAKPLIKNNKKLSRKVFGYHPYWQGTKWQNYNFELLTTIAYFSAEANATGKLVNLHGWPAVDLINKAHENGVEVVLTVTLFNRSDLEILLSSASYRNELIKNLNYEIIRAGADGVNIDFESLPKSQKVNLVTFVKDLRSKLRETIVNAQVTLATPAVDWDSAWNFKALANESDGLFIMGYDYFWKGSKSTGPVSPLNGGAYNVTNTVNTYLSITENNANKIILGNPYYGYEWPSVSGEKGAATSGEGLAVLFMEAEAKALSYGKRRDSESESPWYRYQNPAYWNQGWYSDSLSLSKKYDLIIQKDLGGIGIWALGYDEGYDDLWNAIRDKISINLAPSPPTNLSLTNLGGNVIALDFNESKEAKSYIITQVFSNTNKTNKLGSFSSLPILLNLNSETPSFLKVKASNNYGFSPYTETLGITPSPNNSSVLIVNGFDRVSGTTNSRDFILQHGNAIFYNNYSFDSASNEAIKNKKINLDNYKIVNWILGEEGAGTSSFDVQEKEAVQKYLKNGGRLFISGSEIGYDLSEKGDISDNIFYEQILKAEYILDAAAGKQGTYRASGNPGTLLDGINITFDNGNFGTYDVDWPDGIKPAINANSILRYDGVDYMASGGAGISFQGNFQESSKPGALVYLSIGFESIYPENSRNDVMRRVLNYLDGPIASTNDDRIIIPNKLEITSLYPNPSNSSIYIELQISNLSPIAFLTIADLAGREVFKMSVLSLSTKLQRVKWNGTLKNGYKAPSGVYIASLSQGKKIATKKFTMLK